MKKVELKLTLEFSDDVPEGDVQYIMDNVVGALTDGVNGRGLVADGAEYFTKKISVANDKFGDYITKIF
jgi:hypothetical protein